MSICMRAFVQSCAPAMGARHAEVGARRGDARRGALRRAGRALPSPVERAASGTMSTAAADPADRGAEHAREPVPDEGVAEADEPQGAQGGEGDVEERLTRRSGCVPLR